MFSGILKLLILKGRFPVAALRSIPENDFFIIATQPVNHPRLLQASKELPLKAFIPEPVD